jgi:hypothetical protein
LTPTRIAHAARLAAIAMSMAASAHASLWVSPGGDDANPGTEERPLRSLERARDVVRTLNRDMSDDITVFVGGEFHLARPVEFGSGDSGSNGFNIIYTAAPGEHPVLSGGLRVTGWALADKERNLWSAPAPAGLENTYNVFVNGAPAGRTRGRLLAVFTKDAAAAAATAPDPTAQWKNADDVAFEPSGDEAVWSERKGTLPVFVENAFELLGAPGEWYLDRPARRIYYTPRAGEDMATADVEAAVARALIIGLGTLDRPIAGIIFKGFRFEYTTWHHTPEDEPRDGAPAGPSWGAVSFNYAAGIQFLEDDFLHMGTPALELGPRIDGAAVEGCLFGDIAWSAVRLTEASSVRISQSRLSYVAIAHFPRGAIEVNRSRDIAIEHVQIDHFPAAGILVANSRPDAVREESNRVSPPMIAFHGAAPAAKAADSDAGPGISEDYRALTDEVFSSPTLPGPPTAVSAEAEDGFAYVTWIPNCQDGGSPVESYSVSTSSGAKVAVPARDFEAKGYAVVGDLANGQAVSFTVSAANAMGASPPSLPTSDVKPLKKRKLKAPAPPAAVSFTAGKAGTMIQIAPPASNGGSPVISYSVAAGQAEPVVIEGLDVIHSDGLTPLSRPLPGVRPPPGTMVAVAATNATGEGKPAVARFGP